MVLVFQDYIHTGGQTRLIVIAQHVVVIASASELLEKYELEVSLLLLRTLHLSEHLLQRSLRLSIHPVL